MLFEKCVLDKKEYPHLQSLNDGPYVIINNTDTSFIVYYKTPDIYSIEYDKDIIELDFLKLVYSLNPELIETTNSNIYNILKNNYNTSCACYQYLLNEIEPCSDLNFKKLNDRDLEYVIKTYGSEDYIKQLQERGRIYGYYNGEALLGYIGHHVDGSLGIMYVKEEFRRKGIGKKMVQCSISNFFSNHIYSQVLITNQVSIKFHDSISAVKSPKILYWLYNHDFMYR